MLEKFQRYVFEQTRKNTEYLRPLILDALARGEELTEFEIERFVRTHYKPKHFWNGIRQREIPLAILFLQIENTISARSLSFNEIAAKNLSKPTNVFRISNPAETPNAQR